MATNNTQQSPPAPSSTALLEDDSLSEVDKFASAIVPSLPLLMFGSGDVAPSQVDPDAVSVLAELTATYVSELVSASCDAHDILTDGRGMLPPPNFTSSRKRPREESSLALDTGSNDNISHDLNWENPLPIPKIRKKSGNQPSTKNIPSSKNINAHSVEWKGVQGVQLHDYIRKPYVSIPSTISKRAFIYPICHDAELYSRAKEILANYQDIKPILIDPVIADIIAEESAESLGTSMFGWVGQSLADSVAGHPNDSIITAAVKSKNSKETREMKEAARAASLQKRIGLARRIGIDSEWPGLDEILPSYKSLGI